MKLYIANATCSLTVQVIANELGLAPELVHFDVFGKSTTDGSNFANVNPLLYVPALQLDNDSKDVLTETVIISNYLADQKPESGLAPKAGSLERVAFDALLNKIATEIAQKHIPLMRKLLTVEGTAWTRAKLVAAYTELDKALADGRPYITGENFTVVDAYVWGTMWHERSGAEIQHLKNVFAWKDRVEARASVIKALKDEAELFTKHQADIAAAKKAA